jgi:hypothetical protein
MYRIAQERLVENRQRELRIEADNARLVSRIHRPEPQIEQRVRNVLSLRLHPAHAR